MFKCLFCSGKSFSSKHLLAQHCKGKSHLNNVHVGVTSNESEDAAEQEAVRAFSCSVCPKASFDSELALNRHCKGKRHLELSTGKQDKSASSESLSFNCFICLGASFKTKDHLKRHCEGKKHLDNVDSARKMKESDAALNSGPAVLVQHQKLLSNTSAILDAASTAALAQQLRKWIHEDAAL